MSFHVIERPATMRFPIVSKYPGACDLKRRSGGIALSGRGLSSNQIGLVLSSPSIVIDDVRPTAVTPGACPAASPTDVGIGE